ncbi:hypothetical protein AgCh_034607 [Apium graveolens]
MGNPQPLPFGCALGKPNGLTQYPANHVNQDPPNTTKHAAPISPNANPTPLPPEDLFLVSSVTIFRVLSLVTVSSTGGGIGVSVSSLGVGADDSLVGGGVGEFDCDGGAGGELYCVGECEGEGVIGDSSRGEGEDDGDGEGDCDGYEEVAVWRERKSVRIVSLTSSGVIVDIVVGERGMLCASDKERCV